VSRTLFGAAKSCPLVNLFMICGIDFAAQLRQSLIFGQTDVSVN
jgi:hypothetical protein